jgi:NADPH:quinone reductase
VLGTAARVAYPNGVELPNVQPGVVATAYDGIPDPAAIERLNRLIESGLFEVHVDRTYTLDEAVEAIRASTKHHLGKLALAVGS